MHLFIFEHILPKLNAMYYRIAVDTIYYAATTKLPDQCPAKSRRCSLVLPW